MFLYLYCELFGNNLMRVSMHQTCKGANKRLLEAKREYLSRGWKLVADEKKPGEYRYLKFSIPDDDGQYKYAYVNFSYERVRE